MMITGFGIILEDNILYCSNEDLYNTFEIILFVSKLLSSFNPNQTWRLNNIYLERSKKENERIIIRHYVAEGKIMFIFVSGNFKEGSQVIRNMLAEFFEKIKTHYSTIDILKQASHIPVFNEIIHNITNFLWNKYENLLEKEEIKQKINHSSTNKILYGGISTQGLPIISQLYDKTLLSNLNKEKNKKNIDLFNSSLSAHLATIEMNALIRAQGCVKEIHIVDLEDKKNKKIILYDSINSYSLCVFASGDFLEISSFMKLLKLQLSNEETLQQEFSGDLKPYRYLEQFFSDLEKEF